jgi:hypothetical protein
MNDDLRSQLFVLHRELKDATTRYDELLAVQPLSATEPESLSAGKAAERQRAVEEALTKLKDFYEAHPNI